MIKTFSNLYFENESIVIKNLNTQNEKCKKLKNKVLTYVELFQFLFSESTKRIKNL